MTAPFYHEQIVLGEHRVLTSRDGTEFVARASRLHEQKRGPVLVQGVNVAYKCVTTTTQDGWTRFRSTNGPSCMWVSVARWLAAPIAEGCGDA